VMRDIYKSECIYVCMFRRNYLSVNGIVSFPSFALLYKYKEEYKQREIWHSAQRSEIYIYFFITLLLLYNLHHFRVLSKGVAGNIYVPA
jgi:hypothetical protein